MRSQFLLVICVWLSCLQTSMVLTSSSSLWSKKLRFMPDGQCLWVLNAETVIPALEDLSVCLLLKRLVDTEWTAFVYKAPGNSNIELGLQGTSKNVSIWLFGKETQVEKILKLHDWHSLCITWSGRQQKLQVYINGTSEGAKTFEATTTTHLAPNGTLTLGQSHFVKDNRVEPVNGKSLMGEISRFRIWAKEWSEEELKRQECTDGDVISWDQRHWTNNCSRLSDSRLQCEWPDYNVKMKIIAQLKNTEEKCPLMDLKNITKKWLENIFPSNISVYDIFVSSSHACSTANTFTAVYGQQVQESQTPSPFNSICHTCFFSEVYVNVEPATDVKIVQADITTRLSSPFSLHFLYLTTDLDSIHVLSVDLYSAVTDSPPTVNTIGPSSGMSPTLSVPTCPDNMTDEPLEINKTFDKDTFFRVNLTLGINGFLSNPKVFIEAWVTERLNFSCTMKVLNFLITEITNKNDVKYRGLLNADTQQKHYSCAFHVQEDHSYNVSVLQKDIEKALTSSFANDSIIVQTIHLNIRHIEPKDCPGEKLSTIYGIYYWARTFPQDTQTMLCEEPPSEYAFRLCKLEISTDSSKWAKPDMRNCNPKVTIPQLENVTVTTDNAAEVVETIQDLVSVQLSSSSQLSTDDLDTVVGKLREVVDVGTSSDLGANIVTIVADILVSNTNVTPLSSVVLNLTSKMGHTMDFEGMSESITAPSLALSLCNVDSEGFGGLTFGVSSVSTSLEPQVFVDPKFVSDPIPNIKASISLPSEVQNFFSEDRNTTRVQFQFYATDELFQDLDPATTQGKIVINSYIVSASLNNSQVQNLTNRVVVNLSHQKPTQLDDKVHCAFWDFRRNGGHGGWNLNGCETQSISHYQTTCLCDHLTHFAVLLDVSRTPISDADSHILTIISNVGCGVSAMFLGITLLTYLAFDKLRRDNPAKILINLSAALLGLSMLFLLNSWLSSFSNYSLCIATAAVLHYFLLASFTWMGLEALHMYLALVKVFNIYVPSYILKFCAVGWGLPLVIVSLVLAIDKDSYGGSSSAEAVVALQSTASFCWVQKDEVFYVTVLGFILLILVANLSVFVVVLIQIKRTRINKPSANSNNTVNDLRAVGSLTVLLGLTWSIGFISFGPGRVAMMYLFSILNTLQGFFVFFFHCLMRDNVRKQWRIYLCCGRFRLNDYSDWTRTVTGGDKSKKRNLVNLDSDSSDMTSTRKISESSG